MKRRSTLVAACGVATALLSGCLGGSTADDESSGSDSSSNDDTSNESASGDGADDGSDPEAAIVAFLEAVAAEDEDALTEAVHSTSPLNPEQYEDGEFEFDDADVDPDAVDATVATDDATVDEVAELDETWFDADEVDDDVGDGSIALLEAETGYWNADGETWVLATEAGDWRVYWAVADAPDDSEVTFEDPIVDDDADVVETVDWSFDQEDAGFDSDVDWAQVVLTDSPGTDADTVRIESTVEGWETAFDGDGSNAWAGTRASVALDPEGDQVVVTAVTDDTETVVHRERYEP